MKIFKVLLNAFASKICSTTIFSLSSGQTKAGVAVVRISGPKAKEALLRMTKMKTEKSFSPRKLCFTPVEDPISGEVIDNGLAVWFPGPASFTGEDCCEFHVHGGCAVIVDLLAALSKIEGFAPAEAGEFSKRAFYNGKLDLTSAEGLADLLNAETSAQRKMALRQASGDLKKLYDDWRQILIKCLAHVEAYIDFSEEEQIEDGVLDAVNEKMANLQQQMVKHRLDSRAGERLRNGVHVAIVGKPNVGKSTLLNFLCKRPAAIVTAIAGTTRDPLEIPLDLSGYPLVLVDTAGIRRTEDIVEKEGVERAKQRLMQADLAIIVMDPVELRRKVQYDVELSELSDPHEILTAEKMSMHLIGGLKHFFYGFDHCPVEDTASNLDCDQELLIFLNKADLIRPCTKNAKSLEFRNEIFDEIFFDVLSKMNGFEWNGKFVRICCASCLECTGMDKLLDTLTSVVAEMCGKSLVATSPIFAQQRHRHLINKALDSCQTYFHLVDSDQVLAAECLRKILRNLDKLTGHVTTEEILDCIFRDFCIGK